MKKSDLTDSSNIIDLTVRLDKHIKLLINTLVPV